MVPVRSAASHACRARRLCSARLQAGITALLLTAACGGSAPQTNEPAAAGAPPAPPIEWFTDRAEASGIDFTHVNGAAGKFLYPETERRVGAVERQVAHAQIAEEQALAAGLRVQPHQVAEGRVVRGVEQHLRIRVEGERGDGVDPRPLDVAQLPDRAVLQRDGAEVSERARVVEAGIEHVLVRVDEGAGEGAEGPWRHVGVRGQRVLPDRRHVAPLEVLFEHRPVAPGRLERRAEHRPELRRVVRLRAVGARDPLEQRLG